VSLHLFIFFFGVGISGGALLRLKEKTDFGKRITASFFNRTISYLGFFIYFHSSAELSHSLILSLSHFSCSLVSHCVVVNENIKKRNIFQGAKTE